ncbi:TetR/AcrR family transcriptional regulator [Microbacterium lacus]|uniref:TetR/AcrR family transcriptional regulator n=1 Tax=Microbacterium lacus TaxID=415217 RepID=UPI00384EDF6B
MPDSPAVQATALAAPAARRGRPGYDQRQILEVAVAVFNEQGYDATSVAALADRLGLSKSAMYHHFDSKEQLLSLALDEALGSLEGVLQQPGARAGDAGERLGFVLQGAVTVLVDKLPFVTLLLRVRGNSDVERDALERRRAFDHQVTVMVRAAQEEGSVRDDVEASIATRLLFGMVNSLVEWYRPTGPESAADLADDVLTIALDGLRTR